MSHSMIHFIKRNSKKGNYYFLNEFNFLLYFLQKTSTWNHSLGPPPIISQIRRFLTKLFRNGEKRSQNWENLHKAIYVNFLSPTQGLFKWNFICWITQKLGHFFKEFLASLLVDTTKTPHSCLLIFNLKQRIPP